MMLFLAAGTAQAFHDGGAGNCDGCHTMHNTAGNPSRTGLPNAYLLIGSDSSSICLICHAASLPSNGSMGNNAMVATFPPPAAGSYPQQLTPGGDFAYLQKNYSWLTATGTPASSPGETHGHNITAADFFFFPDSRYTVAPGGFYPATKMGCTSCHDPHGRYRLTDTAGSFATTGKAISESGSYGSAPGGTTAVGSYRLLAGNGYLPPFLATTPAATFSVNPPVAVAPTNYNRSEATGDVRVAYGSGMSEWCGNCHGAYQHVLTGTSTVAAHPSGNSAKLLNVANEYNAYVKSYVATGTFATAYSSLVPFEEGTTDPTALAVDAAATTGASQGSNVTCLTCHRAHASGWDCATRWNTTPAAYLTVSGSWPGIDAPTASGQDGVNSTGKTMLEYQQAMYGRSAGSFATNQGSLCNKCHWNDTRKVLPE